MKKSLIISVFVLVIMIITSNVCYASVEIIPSKSGDGKDALVNSTISNSYLLCQEMINSGECLNGSSVKPHLATNKDWGAVSYLSNSIYGTNTQGGNNGVTVNINGVNYYSTTTNITGVMNWGSNPNITRYTQTSGLIKRVTTDNEVYHELFINKETEFVDYIDSTDTNYTLGMAINEGGVMYNKEMSVKLQDVAYRCSIREGLFGGHFGSTYWSNARGCSSGSASTSATFRPVVWN